MRSLLLLVALSVPASVSAQTGAVSLSGRVVDVEGRPATSGTARTWTRLGHDGEEGACWQDPREALIAEEGRFTLGGLSACETVLWISFERASSHSFVFRRLSLGSHEHTDLGQLRVEGQACTVDVGIVDDEGVDLVPWLGETARESRTGTSWPSFNTLVSMTLESKGSWFHPPIACGIARPAGSSVQLHGLDSIPMPFQLTLRADGPTLERWNVRVLGEAVVSRRVDEVDEGPLLLQLVVVPPTATRIRVLSPDGTELDPDSGSMLRCVSVDDSGTIRVWGDGAQERVWLQGGRQRIYATLQYATGGLVSTNASGSVTIPIGNAPFPEPILLLDRGIRVRGSALDMQGRPLGGVPVHAVVSALAEHLDNLVPAELLPSWRIVTEDDGTFTIPSAPRGQQVALEVGSMPHLLSPRIQMPHTDGSIGEIRFD